MRHCPLQKSAKALAAARGRDYVVPDDLKELAVPVLAHRLVLTPDAQLQGLTVAQVVDGILVAVPVPTTSGT